MVLALAAKQSIELLGAASTVAQNSLDERRVMICQFGRDQRWPVSFDGATRKPWPTGQGRDAALLRRPVRRASLSRTASMGRKRGELCRASVTRLGFGHQAPHAMLPRDAIAERITAGDGEPRPWRIGQHGLLRHAVEGAANGDQQRRRRCECRGEERGARQEGVEMFVKTLHGHLLREGLHRRGDNNTWPVRRAASSIESKFMAEFPWWCRTSHARRTRNARAEIGSEPAPAEGERRKVDLSAAFRTNQRRRIGARAVASRKGNL